MKISEAKSGKVRYAESRAASDRTGKRENGMGRKLHKDAPDFLKYLSEKDRRRWNRLPGFRKDSIIRKASLSGAGREAAKKKDAGYKKGVAGLAVSAAKKAASKIAGVFREKPDQMSGADVEMIRSGQDPAGQEIKSVTGPVKRTAGGIFSFFSLIIGPFLYVIFLVIILVVVIIFILAWLISLLIPVTASAGIVGTDGLSGNGTMPYYCQQDDKWGSYPYDAGTLYTYGCGPTSMAMILACLTGDYSITPITMADYGNQDIAAYGMSVGGTHSAATNIAALYGIGGIEQMAGPYQNCCGLRTAYDLPYIKKKIVEGSPILVSVTGSYCNVRTEGHYFVLYGQGENGVYIYDPATLGRVYQESMDSRGTDWELCLNSAKHIWIFPAPESRITGDSNAEKIFRYLVKAGWSKASAAAAVGNFYQEAGGGGSTDINPASYSNARGAEGGGIAGFTDNGEADSFTALRHYAEQRGKKWTDLQIQCDFLIDQMSHGTWWGAYNTPTFVQMQEHGYSVRHVTYEEFIRMTDVSEATKAFLCFYEDCGYRDAHYEDVRLPMARQAYAAWGS